jgi:glycosyltransferase involved in cell wall biosynthesis
MTTISTSLFLKNEGQTIRRCLDSCIPFTDEFVIGVDNSCTDNTEEEVKKFIEENPGEKIIFYNFDWMESFAYHRNEGMDKCTSDWILVMDGHEYFPDKWKNITENRVVNSQEVMTIIKSHLTSDGVISPEGDMSDCDNLDFALYQQPFIGQTPNNFFMQPRLYRNGVSKLEGHEGKPLRFGRAAHNVIQFTRPQLAVRYPEIIIVHDAPEDNRKERAVQRQEMNIKQLKDDLEKNEKDTRALFYLGNTYLEGKKYDEALEAYDKYIEYDKVENDETYQVYLHQGLAYNDLKEHDKALKSFHQCVRINPKKRDGYLLIGDAFKEQKKYEQAIHNYNIALTIKAPVNGMFSNGGTYTWLPHQQLCQCYKELGNKEMAIAHLKVCLGYENMEGWHKELQELTGDKKNILIVDHIGSFTKDFKEYLEKHKYEVVAVREWSNTLALWADCIFVEWADYNAVHASEFKAKTVIRVHGYEAYLNKNILDQIPWDCKKVIFVADHIKKMIGKDGDVVHNGVDTDKFFIKEKDRDSRAVGYCGYLNGKKNPMRLAHIIKANPDKVFHLRVDWQDEFLKESFEYETQLCKNIVYHGRYDDINDFYNQLTYIISTSDVESFSYQIAEGMSAGCTPLVYNWKGATDIWRADFIYVNLPKFYKKSMKEMRQYIIDNYPLHKQLMTMEAILVS